MWKPKWLSFHRNLITGEWYFELDAISKYPIELAAKTKLELNSKYGKSVQQSHK